MATRRVLRLTGTGGERLDLELHVARDGVAYRYRLPARRLHRVLGEASSCGSIIVDLAANGGFVTRLSRSR